MTNTTITLIAVGVGLAALFLLSARQTSQRNKGKSDAAPPKKNNLSIEATDEEKDAWEGTFWEAEDPFPVKATLLIKYKDGNGLKSERTVNVRNFDKTHYGGMLIGHCQLRDATRTFRTDRISNCIDVETGEIVPDISAHLVKKYESSSDYSAKKLLESDYDTLRVLLYVAKADGRFTKSEKQVFVDVCSQISNDSRMTIETIESMLGDIDQLSVTAFNRAVGRIAKQSVETREIV